VEAGGNAAVFGYSSGANLALQAAAHGLAITKLALYEPPFVVDGSHPRPPAELPVQLAELISAGRRGDAVELFQTKAIGCPRRWSLSCGRRPSGTVWRPSPTPLVYDATIIGDLTLPTELIASIATPTLVIDGEKSPPLMRDAPGAVADALPNGRRVTLPDQTHDIAPDATAAELEGFLS
jgi:pimeloyl-ACP methyl ester carboxylesterase